MSYCAATVTLVTYFDVVGVDVIWADNIGISIFQDDSGVIDFWGKQVEEVKKWWERLRIFGHKTYLENNKKEDEKEKLTGKNVLVSVFALIFWSLAFLSALFHLRLQLLKSLWGGRDDILLLYMLL